MFAVFESQRTRSSSNGRLRTSKHEAYVLNHLLPTVVVVKFQDLLNLSFLAPKPTPHCGANTPVTGVTRIYHNQSDTFPSNILINYIKLQISQYLPFDYEAPRKIDFVHNSLRQNGESTTPVYNLDSNLHQSRLLRCKDN
jgi:hypothetical protein